MLRVSARTPLAWGVNEYGQLGDGTWDDRFTVAPVSNLSGVVAVAAGGDDDGGFSLALKADGTVWAWGKNDNYELGDGTSQSRYRPVPVGGLTHIVAIAAGGRHGLALDADGVVWAWGAGYYGQLGDGTNNSRTSPVRVSGLSNVIAIAAGVYHSLAVTADGSVWAWGYNGYGRLGDGTTTNRSTPVQVRGPGGTGMLSNVVGVAGGSSHSVALKADGTVWTWGENRYGQLGVSRQDYFTSPYPRQVLGPGGTGFLQNIKAIASVNLFTLALATDGTVWGWGYNLDGELGVSTTTKCNPGYPLLCAPAPVQAQGLSDVTAISAGGYHSLALRADGSLWGWGYNYQGQLAEDPQLVPTRTSPAPISGLSDILTMSADFDFSLAVQQTATPPQPPANDNFAAASVLTLPASLSGDTVMATTEAAEPVPAACGAIGKTVWYQVTPQETGMLVASTVGSTFDTRLALYTGSSLSDLTTVACDDNSGPDGTSVFTADVTAGQTYYLQLGGASFFPGTAHAGSFVLKVSIGHRPENDNFAAAMPLTLPASVSGDNTLATVEGGEPVWDCGDMGHTVWYELTPAENGLLIASAQSTTFQPYLALYTGTSFDVLNLESECSSGKQWLLSVAVQVGHKYYLQLGSPWDGTSGDFALEVSVYPSPPNDNFADAKPLNLPGSTADTTLGATTEPGEPLPYAECGRIDHTVWYQFVPQMTGELRLGKEASFSPLVTLYSGEPWSSLQSNYVWSPEVVSSFGIVEAGQTYYLQVGTDRCSSTGLGGDFILHAALGLTPDLVVTALSAVGGPADEPIPVTITMANQGNASTLTSFSVHLFSATSRTPTSQSHPLVAVEMEALDAGASATLNTSLPPDSFESGTHTLTAYADGTDLVRESNEVNNLATVDLTVEPPRVLERDNFAQANLLTLPANVSGSTLQATTEPGEPLYCGSKVMGKTVWFKVIPNATGALTATTTGSGFDTMLAIYTGSSLPGLQQLGCNDDAGGSDRTSRLFQMVTGGETYYLQLGGYGGDGGQFNLQAVLDTSGKPDLVVTSLTAEPASADQPIPVHFTIANYGSGGTGATFRVHLFADLAAPPTTADTPLLIVDNILAPAPGASVTLSAELPAGSLAAGDHVVWALADGQGVVDESDEGNNAASTQVPVAGAPLPPTGPDFTLTVAPPTLALVPGSSASFALSLASFFDFSHAVTLSVEGLPQGVTASFYPATVTPPGTSILALTASPDAATGNFQLTITGTSDQITHTASGAVALNFGLVPMCYGTITGVVTDIETGAPVAGVGVGGTVTDASGRYTITNVGLGTNNAPQDVSVMAAPYGFDPNFWPGSASGTAICGVTTTIDIQVPRKKKVTFSGVISGRTSINDPAVPLPGASVQIWANVNLVGSWKGGAVSGADGTYQIGPLDLNPRDASTQYNYRYDADGYWTQTGPSLVPSDQDIQLNVDATLVAQCTGSISGTVVYDDTGLPAAGFQVGTGQTIKDFDGNFIENAYYYAASDNTGRFSFPSVLLGYNNGNIIYSVSTSTPPEIIPAYAVTTNATLNSCGGTSTVSLRLKPIISPQANYGVVKGLIYDQETGVPLLGASVTAGSSIGGGGTDASGHYRLTVIVGYDQDTSENVMVSASLNGYYGNQGVVTVNAGEEATLDLSLLRKRYGVIDGTVRDAASQQPIAGASVDLPGTLPTAADGKYQTGMLELWEGNQPRQFIFPTTAPGYWPKSSEATISADQTTTVDVELIKICQGATIVGNVVNAVSLQPIEGATVSAGGKSTATDKDGFFRLLDLTVGNFNSPIQLVVSASAPGFYSQSKVVSLFCGANITLDFGRPETAWGTIIGTVTSSRSGGPLPGVFIGSGFGASATSDKYGYYRLDKAPLGPDNADRIWQVTAIYPEAPSQTGNVTAKANQEARLDFQFDVEANLLPVVQDQAVTTDAGVAVNITLAASDPDGDTITLSIVTPPAHGVLSGTPPDLTYTPAAGFSGSDSFTFKANDGKVDSDVATVTITVTSINQPPELAAIGNKTIDEGQLLTFAISATDPDEDTLTYSASSLPDGASFDPGTRTFSWTPSYTQAGSYPGVHFIVIDNGTPPASDFEDITITVNNVNQPPELAAIGNKTVDEGQLLTFAISATDPDGDNLTYSASNLPDGASLDPGTRTFSWTPSYTQAGSYPGVRFIVTDNGTPSASDFEDITVTVNNVNQPPELAAIGNKTVDEGQLLTFAISATDPDGDTLTYSASSLPDGASFDPGTRTFSWTPSYTQAGSYPGVRFTVIDNGTPSASDFEDITITVNNINRPPELAAIGNKTVDEGQLLTFAISATDPDGDNLTYSASSLPDGASFDPGTRTLSWTPSYTQAGSYPGVRFIVTDNGTPPASDFEDITITVNNVNQPPELAAIGNKTVDEGQLLTFAISATDPDGDTLTYSATNLPQGASFNAETMTFTWTPESGQAGSYPDIHFEVSDGIATASENITIMVNNVIFTINAEAGANGSISPSGNVMVNYGADQTFTITPNTGYQITDVLVDGSSVGPVTSYTFTNVTAGHTITASFTANTYTIIVTVGAGGSISPSGSVKPNYGADQTFTITPNTGYQIADVLVDGSSVGPVTSYTFTNVTAGHTITASFTTMNALQFDVFLIKQLHVNWDKIFWGGPGKDKDRDECQKKYDEYLDYRTKFGGNSNKTQEKYYEYLKDLVKYYDGKHITNKDAKKTLDKYDEYLNYKKKYGENDKKTQGKYSEYLKYVDGCHNNCVPPWPLSDFHLYGRMKVPAGMKMSDFEKSAVVALTISSGSLSDSVVFTNGRAKLGTVWQSEDYEKLNGIGLDVEKMSLWWAPNSGDWTGWAGFNISGELKMPMGVNGNTQPPQVTVKVDLTTKTGLTVTGDATVLCKVSDKGSVWQYNTPTRWPNFPFDLPDEDD
jgi:alpha-tubulin suppressor-like RCC1 family protein